MKNYCSENQVEEMKGIEIRLLFMGCIMSNTALFPSHTLSRHMYAGTQSTAVMLGECMRDS